MTPSARRIGYRSVAGLAALAGVCIATAGCSPVYSTSGRLAQTASDASAQAQTAALTLSLVASQRLVAPTAETALSDAIDKLGQDDASLTSTDVSGALETARRRILARLRTSEDLLARARRLVEAQARPAQVEVVVRSLRATAKQLSDIDQQLQGSS
jgi:hypothetical protein